MTKAVSARHTLAYLYTLYNIIDKKIFFVMLYKEVEMEKRKQASDHFCVLCDKKLSQYNKSPVCFAHLENELFKRLVIRCNIFLDERLGSFNRAFNIFLQLYQKPLIDLADELRVPLQTIKLWSQDQNSPAINVQRAVIRFLQKKIIKLRK